MRHLTKAEYLAYIEDKRREEREAKEALEEKRAADRAKLKIEHELEEYERLKKKYGGIDNET